MENLDLKVKPMEEIENRLTKLKFFNQTWFDKVFTTNHIKIDTKVAPQKLPSQSLERALNT